MTSGGKVSEVCKAHNNYNIHDDNNIGFFLWSIGTRGGIYRKRVRMCEEGEVFLGGQRTTLSGSNKVSFYLWDSVFFVVFGGGSETESKTTNSTLTIDSAAPDCFQAFKFQVNIHAQRPHHVNYNKLA